MDIGNYEITKRSITRTLEVAFPGGLDFEMPAPYSGRMMTYRVFSVTITYTDDLPASWAASVAKVFQKSDPSKATVAFPSTYFNTTVRATFDNLARIVDPRPLTER